MRIRGIPIFRLLGVVLFAGWLILTVYQLIWISAVAEWTCSYARHAELYKPLPKGSQYPERRLPHC